MRISEQEDIIEQKMKLLRGKEEAKLRAMMARQDALAVKKQKIAEERAEAKAAAAKQRELMNLCTKVLTKTSAVKMKVQIVLMQAGEKTVPGHVAADLEASKKDIAKLEELAMKYMPGNKEVDEKEKTFLQGVDEHVKAADKAVKMCNGFLIEAAKTKSR